LENNLMPEELSCAQAIPDQAVEGREQGRALVDNATTDALQIVQPLDAEIGPFREAIYRHRDDVAFTRERLQGMFRSRPCRGGATVAIGRGNQLVAAQAEVVPQPGRRDDS